MSGQRSSSSAGVLLLLVVAMVAGGLIGTNIAKRAAGASEPAGVASATVPAGETYLLTFAADAAEITYASINGEQVASNDEYPVVAGDVIVLTVQAIDPLKVGTCGIVIAGSFVDIEHAAAPGPATCEVIIP